MSKIVILIRPLEITIHPHLYYSPAGRNSCSTSHSPARRNSCSTSHYSPARRHSCSTSHSPSREKILLYESLLSSRRGWRGFAMRVTLKLLFEAKRCSSTNQMSPLDYIKKIFYFLKEIAKSKN